MSFLTFRTKICQLMSGQNLVIPVIVTDSEKSLGAPFIPLFNTYKLSRVPSKFTRILFLMKSSYLIKSGSLHDIY